MTSTIEMPTGLQEPVLEWRAPMKPCDEKELPALPASAGFLKKGIFKKWIKNSKNSKSDIATEGSDAGTLVGDQQSSMGHGDGDFDEMASMMFGADAPKGTINRHWKVFNTKPPVDAVEKADATVSELKPKKSFGLLKLKPSKSTPDLQAVHNKRNIPPPLPLPSTIHARSPRPYLSQPFSAPLALPPRRPSYVLTPVEACPGEAGTGDDTVHYTMQPIYFTFTQPGLDDGVEEAPEPATIEQQFTYVDDPTIQINRMMEALGPYVHVVPAPVRPTIVHPGHVQEAATANEGFYAVPAVATVPTVVKHGESWRSRVGNFVGGRKRAVSNVTIPVTPRDYRESQSFLEMD